jgi:hypothetical protein
MKKIMLIVLAWLTMAGQLCADNQYKLLVLAMPGKYHYEYIPIARDSLERWPSCTRSS